MKLSNKDHVELLLDYGIDFRRRTIQLFGEVDQDMAQKCLSALDLLGGDEPITIYLNSEGGDVDHGFVIYDAIKRSKCHITIIATGTLMSMATIIMQAADTRLSMAHTTFMVHAVSAAAGYSSVKSLKSWAESAAHANKEGNRIFGERTKKPTSFWDKKLQHDWVLTAEEAVEVGLIDEIV